MSYRDLEVNEFYTYFDMVLMYVGEHPNLQIKVIFKVILIPDGYIVRKLSSYNKDNNTIQMLKNGLMMSSVYKLESK